MQQKLDVAFSAGDGGGHQTGVRQTEGTRGLDDVCHHARMDGLVAHDAAFADILAPRLELGFDQRDDLAARRQKRRYHRQNVLQRNERHVDRHQSERPGLDWQVLRSEPPRVGAFDDDDPWVGANLPVELVVADVEGDNPGRAALQQHVGEAARGSADVEGNNAGGINAKGVERVRKLEPATTDPGMIGSAKHDLDVAGDRCARFGDRMPSDQDIAGQNQRPRPFARRNESALDEQLIKSRLQEAISSTGTCERPVGQLREAAFEAGGVQCRLGALDTLGGQAA